ESPMLGEGEPHLTPQRAEEDDQRLFDDLPPVALFGHAVGDLVAKVGIEGDLVGADAGLLLELAKRAFPFTLPLLPMALGEVEAVVVLEEQEGAIGNVAKDKHTTRHDLATHHARIARRGGAPQGAAHAEGGASTLERA